MIQTIMRYNMLMKQWAIVLLVLVMTTFSGICSAASDPTTMPLVLTTNTSEPFDDEEFMTIVNPVIDGLTDRSLNSSERIDVQSVYYSASAMKVSPQFYPDALNLTKLLFYLVTSSETDEELEKSSGLGTHNNDVRDSLKEQLKADESVAEEAWRGLRHLYPNSTLFR
ncbi:MAG: hypothetical protein GXY18_06270 [Methanomicrobiales archaeon]|nr:hypothetical protein [Methanomicrobiales archaeon]